MASPLSIRQTNTIEYIIIKNIQKVKSQEEKEKFHETKVVPWVEGLL